ncbi:hypothetical protein ACVDG3_15945 [Meridianimarinicoccus sp. RP-17]|uniref:hypothetical protein n=1 Tax=Meridianimarinicoccus zhengii TaxID=2056810 RepID=UPI0013A69419|nr:hypothetical protein [Phycocomes zhengii]
MMEVTITINVPDMETADAIKHMGVLCIPTSIPTFMRLRDIAAPQLEGFTESKLARLEAAHAKNPPQTEEQRAAFVELYDKATQADNNAHMINNALRAARWYPLASVASDRSEDEGDE